MQFDPSEFGTINESDSKPVQGIKNSGVLANLEQSEIGIVGVPASSSNGSAVVQDIITPIKNPSLILDNMRAGVASGVAGYRAMQAANALEGTTLDTYDKTDQENMQTAQELTRQANESADYAKQLNDKMDSVYKPQTRLGKILKGVTGSSPSMMVGTALSLVAGPVIGASVGSALGAAQVGFTKYDERRQMGDAPDASSNAAAIHMASEGLSEVAGMGAIVNLFKKAKLANLSVGALVDMSPAIAREAVTEAFEEVAAGIPQGMEDAYRGQGKDPSGIQGIKDYIQSGQMVQQGVDDFLGGFIMGGGTGVGLLPVHLSYRAKALDQVAIIDSAIQDATDAGNDSVQVGNSVVPLETLRQKRQDLAEAFEIKSTEIEERAKELIQKAELADNPVEQERKNIEDPAINRLAGITPEEETPVSNVVEPAAPISEISLAIEPTAAVDQAVAEPAVVETAAQDAAEPTALVEQKSVDSNFQTFSELLSDQDVSNNLHSVGEIKEEALDVIERLRSRLGVQGKAVVITTDALKGTEFGNFLLNLAGDSVNVDQVTGGEHWSGLVDPSTGKRFSVVVMNSKYSKSDAVTQVVLSHEAIGHGVFYDLYDKAPQLIRDRIETDFGNIFSQVENFSNLNATQQSGLAANFFDSMGNQVLGKGLLKILERKADETPDAFRNRIRKEWIAHQITKSVYSSKPAQNLLQAFWNKVATAYKTMFQDMQESNVDTLMGVKSVRDFVDHLYRAEKNRLYQLDVENFNTKLADQYQRTIVNTLRSMGEMVDGKFRVFKSWITYDNTKQDVLSARLKKISLSYRYNSKVLNRYIGKGGMFSSFGIVDTVEQGSWTIVVNTKNPKTGKTESTPIFSMEKNKFQSVPGISPNNGTYYLMKNIKDMLAIIDGLPKDFKAGKDIVKTTLSTKEGKAFTLKVPQGRESLANLFASIKRIANEQGSSELQVLTEILAGEHNSLGTALPGVKGTPVSEPVKRQMPIEFLQNVREFKEKFPAVFKELYGAIQAEEPSTTEIAINQEAEKELVEESKVEETPKTSALTEVENAIIDIIEASPYIKGKKVDGKKVFEEVGWRFINELTDPTLKNYAESFALGVIEERLGESLEIKLKNHSKVAEVEAEMRELGIRTLHSGGVQFVDQMMIGSKGAANIFLPGEENFIALGPDVLDTKERFLISDADMVVSAEGGKLRDTVSHSALLKAYPEMLDYTLVYTDKIPRGRFDSNSNTIYINSRFKTSRFEARNKAVAHELQHAVQTIEGFAKGSSPEFWKQVIARMKSYISEVEQNLGNYTKEDILTAQKIDSMLAFFQEYAPADKKSDLDTLAFIAYELTGGEQEATRTERTAHRSLEELAGKDFTDYKNLRKKSIEVQGAVVYDLGVPLDIPGFVLDMTAFPLFQEMYRDSLDIDDAIARLGTKKPSKAKKPKYRTEGVYAHELNKVKKKKKVRIKKKPDPAKQQKKKEDLLQFIIDMDVLADGARHANQDLATYMKKTGKFTPDQIRMHIGKYNVHKSMFSQTEIIMRLAHEVGLVDETGISKLSAVIKSIFPDTPSTTTDELGNTVNIIEPGSDGTIESLGVAARERLIHVLQNMIVNRDGVFFAVQGQETVPQRVARLEEEQANAGLLSKIGKAIKWFESSGESLVGTTVSGRELVYRLKRMTWKKTLYQRDWLLRLDSFKKYYNTPDRIQYSYELLQEGRVPANDIDRAFVELIQTINVVISSEMQLLQVKTLYKNGFTEYYQHDPVGSKDYFPHMFKDFNKPSIAMIQSLIDSGNIPPGDPFTSEKQAEAVKWIKLNYRPNYIKAQRFANMEMARESELGGWITDPFEVYYKYVTKATGRLAQLREFGSTPDVALAQFALKHMKESRNPEALENARDLIQSMLGVKIEKSLAAAPRWAASYGMMLGTGLMLHHAAIVQPSTAFAMGMVGGWGNLVKGITTTLRNPKGHLDYEGNQITAREWAKLSGVLAFTMNKELYDLVMEDQTKKTADMIVRKFGIVALDSSMRMVGAQVGKLYGLESAMQYRMKQTPKLEARVKRLGLDPAKIMTKDPSTEPVLDQQDLRQCALAFTEETNFVANPFSTPSFLKNHPLGRVFFLFSRFAFQQHQLWKTVIGDSKGKALGGILAMITGGVPIAILKMLLSGDDPEKVLERDGIARFIWKAFTTAGGPGLFAEAMGNAVFGAIDSANGKGSSGSTSRMSMGGPLMSAAGSLADGLRVAATVPFSDEEMSQSEINKLVKAGILSFQATMLGIATARPETAPVTVGLSTAVGFAKPMAERAFYPTKSKEETSIFSGR